MRAYDLPVPGIPHLYTHLPKTPRTEPGKNDLHYCQRTTASGDCRLRPAGAERNRFGNAISGWAGSMLEMFHSLPYAEADSAAKAAAETARRIDPARIHIRLDV